MYIYIYYYSCLNLCVHIPLCYSMFQDLGVMGWMTGGPMHSRYLDDGTHTMLGITYPMFSRFTDDFPRTQFY